MQEVIEGSLHKAKIEWNKDACVGVVMPSGGYPGTYRQGYPITGLDSIDKETLVFHAGTKMNDGEICTTGGRVLSVVATGKTIVEARGKAYRNVSLINFENCHYRKDIAEEA